MSDVALFALGAGVSLLAFAALALLVAGAVLDGRDERARRDAAGVSVDAGAPFALPNTLGPAVAGRVVPFPTKEGEAA
jgi:hypothetical protein